MNTLKRTVQSSLFIILSFCLLLSTGCKSTGEVETDKLYFEPPDRLIDDYAGMFQTDEVNWAWTQIGFRLSNYQSLSLKPFHLFIHVPDKGLAHKLDQGLLAWFQEAGIKLSDSGTIVCEGAIVEVKLERGFFQKLNLFAEDKRDFLLEVEVVIKETATNTTICKIRHGAIGADVATVQERVLAGITSYFGAYK
jgi:hypothetical protein